MLSLKWRKPLCGLLTLSLCAALAIPAAAAAESGGPGGTPPDASSSFGGGTPPDASASFGGPGGGGANTMTYDYDGTLTGTLTADGTQQSSLRENLTAAAADENAALVENGGTLTVANGTLSKSGSDTNGDNCNFYGINSIVLAVGENSMAYLTDSTLSADSEGSNGIFATDNATVYAKGDTIATTADNSRGLDATYGGTIIADDLDISTQGDHCAALATDRGGGNISVTNSTLATAGSGSPLLYSTGNIEVDGVTGTAAGSQLAGMEGLNTIRIYNSTLTSTITSATASDPMADGIIIYQSTSGDAESTTGSAATFEASNSTLKSAIASGSLFYITNTTANVILSRTTLDFDSSAARLLTVQGNSSNNWGTAGSNGASVNFTGLSETLTGDIDVDTISTLNLYLLQGTVYTGAVSISANAVNTKTSSAPVTVNVDGSSRWVVTGSSTVTNLNAAEGASIVDADGKTVSIVANGTTVVTGESAYTVTVTGSYTTTVTTGDVNALQSDFIDRTAFDTYYGVTTSFGTASGAASVTTVSADSTAADTAASQTSDTSADTRDSIRYWIGAGTAAVVMAGYVLLQHRKSGKASGRDAQ